ncbi:hypothetical protein BdWA1_000064 [Babesia duncani]|uniref:Uncharacterized protein n=1 Tax=Babesia duncani TaxID=323732 RepID=A0AAD9PLJ6_9APIC|nr:hypothetical protein BdWA1_000064 [Babesia duncani]
MDANSSNLLVLVDNNTTGFTEIANVSLNSVIECEGSTCSQVSPFEGILHEIEVSSNRSSLECNREYSNPSSCECDLEYSSKSTVHRQVDLNQLPTCSTDMEILKTRAMAPNVQTRPQQQTSPQLIECRSDLSRVITGNYISPNILGAPEIVSSFKTRSNLTICRELFVGIIGAQLVYMLTSLLFGNVPCAIIVSLACMQSIVCHCDARPLAYCVNAILTIAIACTILVSLITQVAGLEPFNTDPLLRILSYVYVPLCFVFAVISIYLAMAFRSLHKKERRAILEATSKLVGDAYTIDYTTLQIKPNHK